MFLTDEEKAWANYLSDELDSRWGEIARVKYESENKLLDRFIHYFPKYGVEPIGKAVSGEKILAQTRVNKTDRAKIDDGMTKERTSTIYPLKLDATSIWLDAVAEEEHYIAFKEWGDTAQQLITAGGDDAVNMNIARMIEITAGKGYADALSDYVNRLIGWKEDMDYMSTVLNKYVSKMGVARIAGSLPSALKNTLSIIPGLFSQKTSASAVGRAMSELTGSNRKNTIDFIYSHDAHMKYRTSEIFIGNYKDSEAYNKFDDVSKQVCDKLLWFMKTIDQNVADVVWLSAYYTAQEKGMNELDSSYYASQVVLATQSTGEKTAVTKAQASKNMFMKFTMMFTSDTVNMFNLMFYDARKEFKLNKLNGAGAMKQMATLARFAMPIFTAMGSALFNFGWLPEDDEGLFDVKQFTKDAFGEMVQAYSPVPPLAEAISNKFTGESWKNSETFPIFGDVADVISKTGRYTIGKIFPDSGISIPKGITVVNSYGDLAISLMEILGAPAALGRRIGKTVINTRGNEPQLRFNFGYMYNSNLGNSDYLALFK
jgi:hypothetical protein